MHGFGRHVLSALVARRSAGAWIFLLTLIAGSLLLNLYFFGLIGRTYLNNNDYQLFSEIKQDQQPFALRKLDSQASSGNQNNILMSADVQMNIAKAISEASSDPGQPITTALPDNVDGSWRRIELCQVTGWGQYSSIIARLVTNGYGNCATLQRSAARSPIIVGQGYLFGGITLVVTTMFLLALIALAITCAILSKPYKWLYESSAFKG